MVPGPPVDLAVPEVPVSLVGILAQPNDLAVPEPPRDLAVPEPPRDLAVPERVVAVPEQPLDLLRPERPADLAVTPVQSVPVAAAAAPDQTTSSRHVQPVILEAVRGLRSEGGRTSLVVRLDPPELGAVLVRLTVRDGQVDVTLRTPDLVARGDLQAQSFDIQQVLREQGLDLASFDVAHGDVLEQQERQERQTPDRGTPRRPGSADGSGSVTDDVSRLQPAGTWL